jgi:receptor protein-tyrosine kinase
VSLIERASKRLEELKRTGVQIPDGLASSARRADARGVTEAVAPPSVPERVAAWAEISELRGERPATPRSPPTQPPRVAKRITIDLERLGAQGFVTTDAPRSPIASEFRVIKRPLIANVQGRSGIRPKNANLVMITSALAGEGKSFCALNLAMSIAMEQDNTVLLVDADVASPSLLDLLGLPPARGLMDVLTDPNSDLASVILRTNVDKLSILPAGTPHQRATEFLASESMSRLVEELATRYPDRIILFDSPPLLLTTESPVLATHMGQVVVAVEAEQTTASTLKNALATIEQCPVVMTMLNKARVSEIGPYYGYGYRYAP